MNYLRQTAGKPLFPDVLWSRPENKRYAGKLLIVGGHAHSLTAPGKAFAAAEAAGIGSCRVILPGSAQKVLGKSFLEAEFTPSTPSGSFSQSSLDQILEAADWADGVLLAGDFGKNSETAVLLEKFLQKHAGQITMAGDAVDYFLMNNSPIFNQDGLLTVADFSKLQKAAKNNRPQTALLHTMDVLKLADALNSWTNSNNVGFLTEHQGQLVVSLKGSASLTALERPDWQASLPSYAAVWRLQQPSKPFEALTAAVYDSLSNP